MHVVSRLTCKRKEARSTAWRQGGRVPTTRCENLSDGQPLVPFSANGTVNHYIDAHAPWQHTMICRATISQSAVSIPALSWLKSSSSAATDKESSAVSVLHSTTLALI